MVDITHLTATNCRFFNITASGIIVRGGLIERCFFKECIFDESSLVLVFKSCEFQQCYFRGASGFMLHSCKCSRVQLFDLGGCTVQDSDLYRCIIDSDLPLVNTTTNQCEDIASRRGIDDGPRRDGYEPYAEPYEESYFPSYRSAGEILSTLKPDARPSVGGAKEGLRRLRAAREGLSPCSYSLKEFLRTRLRRPGVFGLTDNARNTLDLLVSVDKTSKGLVWPTIHWLAGRNGIPPSAVLSSLAELKDRGWIQAYVHSKDLDATWLDYGFAQRHMDAPP